MFCDFYLICSFESECLFKYTSDNTARTDVEIDKSSQVKLLHDGADIEDDIFINEYFFYFYLTIILCVYFLFVYSLFICFNYHSSFAEATDSNGNTLLKVKVSCTDQSISYVNLNIQFCWIIWSF